MGNKKINQPKMLEMISANKYDDVFKNSIRDYYTYGFKNVEDFNVSKQTVNKNWKLISRLLGDDWEFVKEKKTKQNHMDLKTEVNETVNPLNVLYQFRGKSSIGEFLNYLFILDSNSYLRQGLKSLGIEEEKLKEYLSATINYQKDPDDYDYELELKKYPYGVDSIILNDRIESLIIKKWVENNKASKVMINAQLNSIMQITKYSPTDSKDKYKTLSTKTKNLFEYGVLGNLKYDVNKRNNFLKDILGDDVVLNDDQDACMNANDYWYKSPLTMKKLVEDDKAFARKVSDMVDFFSNHYVLGELGYILKQRLNYLITEDENSYFRFKHNYIQKSLYDYNLSDVIDIKISEDSIGACVIQYTHGVRGNTSTLCMIPLQIRIGVTNGREYVVGYDISNRKLISCRMEFIDRIVIGFIDSDNADKFISGSITPKKIGQERFEDIYNQIKTAYDMLPSIWGTDVGRCKVDEKWKDRLTMHTINIKYDEENEDFIRRRLERELRRYISSDIKKEKVHFSCFPTKELRSWIRSFYCRVKDLDFLDSDFDLYKDVNDMYDIYFNGSTVKESESIAKADFQEKLDAPGGVCGHDMVFNEVFSLYTIALANSIIKYSNGENDSEIEEIISEEVKKAFKDFYSDQDEIGNIVEELKGYLEKSELIEIGEDYIDSRFITYAEDYLYDFLPITKMECKWLKTILDSPLSDIFIDKDERKKLVERIDNNIPCKVDAFRSDKLYYYDRYIKEESKYKEYENIKNIFESMQSNKKVDVVYKTRHNKKVQGIVNPAYIQYSVRNDTFQIWIYPDINGKKRLQKLNAFSIEKVEKTDKEYSLNESQSLVNKYIEKHEEKINIEFYEGGRNLPDRILTEFSIYKKKCERDKETNKYNMQLYYDKEDEKEILIRMLSFGPYIKVTSDDENNFICNEIRRRIKVQKDLLDK